MLFALKTKGLSLHVVQSDSIIKTPKIIGISESKHNKYLHFPRY